MMQTAFQSSGFQNNAFQIAAPEAPLINYSGMRRPKKKLAAAPPKKDLYKVIQAQLNAEVEARQNALAIDEEEFILLAIL